MEIPDGISVEIKAIRGAKGLASAYNQAIRESNVKYKVRIVYFRPVRRPYQPVLVIDGLFMVTQFDIAWREDLYDSFLYYEGPQSLEYIKRGYIVAIPYQKTSWIMHWGPEVDRTPEQHRKMWEGIRKNAAIFVREYKEFIGKDVSCFIRKQLSSRHPKAYYTFGGADGMMDGMTYYSALPSRILEYIHDEIRDSLYYQELAKEAPDDRAKELYLEFSRDEATHAANFRQVYIRLTGMEPATPQVAPPEIPPYCDAVKQRIMAESGDFVKYGEEFINAPDCELRDLFYITGAIEARHGMRLSTLLCGVEGGRRDCR